MYSDPSSLRLSEVNGSQVSAKCAYVANSLLALRSIVLISRYVCP
jgi:hypothetical protein